MSAERSQQFMAYCERPSIQFLREASVRLSGSQTLPEPALRRHREAVPGAGAQKAALSGAACHFC